MGLRRNKPGPMKCPRCNGVGRIHAREWVMGKGYVDKGVICFTCKGQKILPE